MKHLIVISLLMLLLSACNASSRDVIIVTATEDVQTLDPTSQAAVPTATPTATSTPTSTPTATSTVVISVPTATPTATTSCVIRTDWVAYTVVAGDTLSRLAQRTGSTTGTLVQGNCLANANVISAGQVLRLPRLPDVTAVPTSTFTPTPTPTATATATEAEAAIFFSAGNPAPGQCVVMRTRGIPPLFGAATETQPLNAGLGNWGTLIETVNGFHHISIVPESPAVIVSAWVRASEVTVEGCEPTYTYVGSVLVSPFLTFINGVYELTPGQTVILQWVDAPAWVLSARFYTVSERGTSIDIGTDTTPGDGFTMSWVVPADLDGHQLLAQGPGVNAAPFNVAISNAVYVNAAEPNVSCEVVIQGDVPLYRRPELTADITGVLTAGTRLPLTGRTSDGWYGVAPGPGAPGEAGQDVFRWIAPGSQASFTTNGCSF
ncbi:MAG: hypothetical protein OHK0046_31260 [Anaerolineae bacterium]